MNERVRALRKELGLTLAEFGEAIGFTTGGLSDLERGRCAVSEKHIKLITNAFKQVNEHWLRTGDGPMFKEVQCDLQEYLRTVNIPEVAKQYVALYDERTPEVQAYLDQIMRDLLAKLMAKYEAEHAEGMNDSDTPSDESEKLGGGVNLDIEDEVESYRQELLAEKKGVFPSQEHAG